MKLMKKFILFKDTMKSSIASQTIDKKDISVETEEYSSRCCKSSTSPRHFSSALIESAMKADTMKIREILQSDPLANPDSKDHSGFSPLMISASIGNAEAIGVLLEYKASIDDVNADGCSALTLAATNGHERCVEKLVKHGANSNLVNRNGLSAVMVAVENDSLQIVKVLFEEGNADVELKFPSGNTPLLRVCSLGYSDWVKFLIEQCQANIEARNDDENTPLMEAARCGNIRTVDMLLDYGAKIGERNKAGKTATMLAFENDFMETTALLLRRGANVNDADLVFGRTMLHWAAAAGKAWKIKFLLSKGANATITDQRGQSAFAIACGNGQSDCVRILTQNMEKSVKKTTDSLKLMRRTTNLA